jgi:hypothetical protein
MLHTILVRCLTLIIYFSNICKAYDSDDDSEDAEAQEYNVDADASYSPYANRIVSKLKSCIHRHVVNRIIDDAARNPGQLTSLAHVQQPVQDNFVASQGMPCTECPIFQSVPQNAIDPSQALW